MHSWKAFFFGSLDSSSFITVDKAAGLALGDGPLGPGVRVLELSMLVPQALEGVGAGLAAVPRPCDAGSARRPGSPPEHMLAITPVAALMFRFNNPDALLVMLLVASAYCMVRALGTRAPAGSWRPARWWAFAFLTKMGQALLVVPGFGLALPAYLICAPPQACSRSITGSPPDSGHWSVSRAGG